MKKRIFLVMERDGYLTLFTKKVGQKYVMLEDYGWFKEGEIVTLIEIHEDNISLYKRFNDYDYLLDIDHVECQVRFYEDAEEE